MYSILEKVCEFLFFWLSFHVFLILFYIYLCSFLESPYSTVSCWSLYCIILILGKVWEFLFSWLVTVTLILVFRSFMFWFLHLLTLLSVHHLVWVNLLPFWWWHWKERFEYPNQVATCQVKDIIVWALFVVSWYTYLSSLSTPFSIFNKITMLQIPPFLFSSYFSFSNYWDILVIFLLGG